MAPSNEKFKQPLQPPPLWTGTPVSILGDARDIIEHSRNVLDQIVRAITPDTATYANVLEPLAQDDNCIRSQSYILEFYKNVSTDSDVRDASGEASKLLRDYFLETRMRDDLYRLVDAVRSKNEDLDPGDRFFLENQYMTYARNGLTLPAGSQRDRFKEINQQLNQLSIEFRRNDREAQDAIWLLPHELEGVPEDALSRFDQGTGENEGKLGVKIDYISSSPIFKFCVDRETRRRVFMAQENRAMQNVSPFKETMVLRDEAARLLGYPDHATFRLEAKMAKEPEAVNTFLVDLKSRLLASGQSELEQMKQLEKEEFSSRGEVYDERFYLWDSTYYKEILLRTKYSVDQEKIAEYFPLDTTIEGMLRIFQHLFGLVFVEVVGNERNKLAPSRNGNDLLWQEDVQIFTVWDDESEGGEFLGYLYLDAFPREGKAGGVSNYDLKPSFIREDGTRSCAATAIICNFSKPVARKPRLLKHQEVVSLFHELGHGIHNLVSNTRYARFAGTATVIDFGEAPSQMLENWCWTPSILKSLSKHYSYLSSEYHKAWAETAEGRPQPPEQIPDATIDSMVRAKLVVWSPLLYLRLLHYGIFDMKIHQPESHEEIENLNVSALFNKGRKEILHVDGPEILGEGYEWGHGYLMLGNWLVSSDYDVGYYGYLYSQVFADDIFQTAFAADPMDRKEGLRYRRSVLEKGGAQDEMKTVTDFLGREVSMDAFYKAIGAA